MFFCLVALPVTLSFEGFITMWTYVGIRSMNFFKMSSVLSSCLERQVTIITIRRLSWTLFDLNFFCTCYLPYMFVSFCYWGESFITNLTWLFEQPNFFKPTGSKLFEIGLVFSNTLRSLSFLLLCLVIIMFLWKIINALVCDDFCILRDFTNDKCIFYPQ